MNISPGQPVLSGNSRCVQMQSTGLWRTLDCSHGYKFVCEMLPGKHYMSTVESGDTKILFAKSMYCNVTQ